MRSTISVTDAGGGTFRVTVEEGATRTVHEVTVTVEDIARYAPGTASDEQAEAAPIVLLGHDAWCTRFDADPSVVERTISLGGVPTMIVGIMPESFA